jgi:PAS domain S-box-containing protein
MSEVSADRGDLLTFATIRWFNDLATQGLFTTDAQLIVRSWNRYLEDQTGLAASDVIGRPLFEAVPDIQSRGLDAHFRAALGGEARVLSHRFHKYLIPSRPGAAAAAQSARITPLEENGAVVGTLTVIEDVSERVASERELRNRIEAAETARGVAEDAVRAKDEFLATLSHEIRTPLNAVLGWTKILLARTVEPAMLTRALQVIDRNAEAQTRLIDDMLDMARIMSGKLRLETQPVDLSAIALTAIDVVAPTAAAKGVALLTKISTDAPWMLGDADRLQQIVWNLLSNAIKFTESGGSVTLGLSREGSTLTLWVEDTGRGISPDFLPIMFERFRQADASSSRRHGGLGLGLSLVRTLTELHGGQIAAASTEGVGSRFTITFPARTDLEEDLDVLAAETLAPSLAGRRVLLVEDQTEAREILSAALQHCGVEIFEAASTRQALEQLDRAIADDRMPDVIISDIGLPDEDGYKLMAQLSSRGRSLGGKIPVIAVTAYGRPLDKRRALAAGFCMHLTKPIDPGILAAAVASVIPKTGRR